MKKIARTLEQSLAVYSPSGNQESERQRQADLQLRTGTDGLVTQSIDAYARRHFVAASKTLDILSRAIGGVSYVGNGAQASVFKKGDQVVKIYRKTARMDDEGRETFKVASQASTDTLRKHLGSIILPQQFVTGDHVLGGYTVVMGLQTFQPGAPVSLFTQNTTDLHEKDIEKMCTQDTAIHASLTGLVDASYMCNDTTGLVPDLNGQDNFRLTGGAGVLRMIDVQPIARADHPSVHSLILCQADTLGQFLDKIS